MDMLALLARLVPSVAGPHGATPSTTDLASMTVPLVIVAMGEALGDLQNGGKEDIARGRLRSCYLTR